jgi:hypothetical protein
VNITDDGFPESVPALQWWKQVYAQAGRKHTGFAQCIMIESDGQFPIGSSGRGERHEFDIATAYNPDKFLIALNDSLDWWQRVRVVRSEPKLPQQEIDAKLLEIKAAAWEAIVQAYIPK